MSGIAKHFLFGLMFVLSATPSLADDTYPAIFFAAYNNEVGIARQYLASGGDIEVRDSFGRTPLMAASELGNLEVLKFLLESGADTGATNHGMTALDVASTDEIKRVITTFNK